MATLHQESLSAPFFQQHLLSLYFCHILVIIAIFPTFSLLFTIAVVLGYHKACPYKTANLKNVMCVLAASPTADPLFPLFLRLPYFLRHNNIEIRLLNNPTVASECSSKKKSCTSHAKSEARKAKARPLAPNSQVVSAKEKF